MLGWSAVSRSSRHGSTRWTTRCKRSLPDFQTTICGKSVDRGNGSTMPMDWQLDTYLQAVLIFFGKATIYLRVMGKPLPEQMREYIG